VVFEVVVDVVLLDVGYVVFEELIIVVFVVVG
jgi:hypothetical protein